MQRLGIYLIYNINRGERIMNISIITGLISIVIGSIVLAYVIINKR